MIWRMLSANKRLRSALVSKLVSVFSGLFETLFIIYAEYIVTRKAKH